MHQKSATSVVRNGLTWKEELKEISGNGLELMVPVDAGLEDYMSPEKPLRVSFYRSHRDKRVANYVCSASN